MPGSAAGTEDTAVDKADRFYFHGAPVPKQETDKYIKRGMEQNRNDFISHVFISFSFLIYRVNDNKYFKRL